MEELVLKGSTEEIVVPEINFLKTFQFLPLTICPLPLKVKNGEYYWETQNGNMRVSMKADPNYGLPKGRDILVVLWLIFKAIENGNKRIVNPKVSDFIKFYGLNNSSKTYKEIQDRFLRILYTGWNWTLKDGEYYKGKNLSIVEDWGLYFDSKRLGNDDVITEGNKLKLRGEKVLETEYITLSEAFYNTVVDHKIPYNLETVKKIKNKPFLLNLYLFLNWRAFTVYESYIRGKAEPLEIPLFGKFGLKNQITSNCSTNRVFKSFLFSQIDELKKYWTKCPVNYVQTTSAKDKAKNKQYKDVIVLKVTSFDQLDVQPDMDILIGRALKK